MSPWWRTTPYLSSVKKLLSALLLLFTASLAAQTKVSASDTLSPLQIVQQYVSPAGFPNKLKFFCCEFYREWYADSTLGQQLPARVKRETELVFQDSAHAAVHVWLHDSLTSRDVYFFLVKKQNWTLYAARSLAMTNNAKLEQKRLDSIPQEKRGKSYTEKSGHSYAFDYANLKLWSGTDAELVAYFNAHKKQFLQLQASLTKKGFYGKTDSLVEKAMQDKKIRKKADALLIRNFQYNPKYPGAVFYMIGGMSDNTVGYFYQPDPTKVPHMTEKKFILVRPLGDGWYLFKTT